MIRYPMPAARRIKAVAPTSVHRRGVLKKFQIPEKTTLNQLDIVVKADESEEFPALSDYQVLELWQKLRSLSLKQSK